MKTQNKAFKTLKYIIIIGAFAVILLIILTPALVFFSRFKNFQLSTNMTDWSAFGSYFGGITGSIISFFSLLILGYITYMVGKNSTKENKNLFIYKKRIEAYDELIKLMPQINSFPVRTAKLKFKLKFGELIDRDKTPESLYEKYIDLLDCFNFYPDFHYFLYNFNARYNHIFKYDFNSKSYKDLLNFSENFNNSILSRYNDFDPQMKSHDDNKIDLDFESFIEMHKHLVTFINEIKKELD